MEALKATYGSDSEGDDSADGSPPRKGCGGGDSRQSPSSGESVVSLPPPPMDLLQLPNPLAFSPTIQGHRVRNFPHVEGNYALHVYIPVIIPSTTRKQLAFFVKRIASLVPSLYVVDIDVALSELSKDDQKLEQILLGREFHISLGRTVPIQVHQFDTIAAMLRQKLQSQRRYWIEFSKWDAFVNDDKTRSFLSLEVLGTGLSEISKQIHVVDEVYRLHGLPEFYKYPRPHISLVWALGDISNLLKQAIGEIARSHSTIRSSQKYMFMCQFGGIECKIGMSRHSGLRCKDRKQVWAIRVVWEDGKHVRPP